MHLSFHLSSQPASRPRLILAFSRCQALFKCITKKSLSNPHNTSWVGYCFFPPFQNVETKIREVTLLSQHDTATKCQSWDLNPSMDELPHQWTWVWVNSGRWWRTGKPGVLQSMGLQGVRHDWATKLTIRKYNNYIYVPNDSIKICNAKTDRITGRKSSVITAGVFNIPLQ